jgi:hypothetical protein
MNDTIIRETNVIKLKKDVEEIRELQEIETEFDELSTENANRKEKLIERILTFIEKL